MYTEQFRAYTSVHKRNNTPRPQVVEYMSSVSHESRRVSDPFVLILTENGLYSPALKQFVKDAVDKSTPIGKIDDDARIVIEEITKREKSGTIVWASNALQAGEIPKVTGYEIYSREVNSKEGKKTVKILFAHSIVLDLENEYFFEMGNYIAEKAGEGERSSYIELRAKPVFLKGRSPHWTRLVEEWAEDENLEKVRNKADWKIKQHTLREIDKNYENIMADADLNNPNQTPPELFGPYSLSCPPSNEQTVNLADKVNCPNCKKVVYVKIGQICQGCKQVRPC